MISVYVPPLSGQERRYSSTGGELHRQYNQRLARLFGHFPQRPWISCSPITGRVMCEMENAVERSMVLAKGDVIGPEDLPPELSVGDLACDSGDQIANLGRLEKDHVQSVLERCDWNKFKAAQMMGISRSTLYSKIKKHGLENIAQL